MSDAPKWTRAARVVYRPEVMHILLPLASVVGLFAAYVATRPAAFRITRARTIDAPAASIFALINDFRAWAKWSPWEKLDPAMARAFEGPTAGVGAVYRWAGKKSGDGAMKILESAEPSRIEIELTFIKPIAATNKTVFTLEPDGAGTKVTWTMSGHHDFMGKAFSVVMNMDKTVGGDFARGLDAMAAAARG